MPGQCEDPARGAPEHFMSQAATATELPNREPSTTSPSDAGERTEMVERRVECDRERGLVVKCLGHEEATLQ